MDNSQNSQNKDLIDTAAYRQHFRNVYSEDFLCNLLLPAARRKSATDLLNLAMDCVQVVTSCGQLDDVIIHIRVDWETPFHLFDGPSAQWPIYSIKGFEEKQLNEYRSGRLDEKAKTLAPPPGQAATRIVKGVAFGEEAQSLIRFLKRFGITAGGISYSWMPHTHPETLFTLFYNFSNVSDVQRPSDGEVSLVEELTIPFALALLMRHKFISEEFLRNCFRQLAGMKPLRLRIIREIINSENFESEFLANKIGVSVPTIRYHIRESAEHLLRLKGLQGGSRKHQMMLIQREYSFLMAFGLWRKTRGFSPDEEG